MTQLEQKQLAISAQIQLSVSSKKRTDLHRIFNTRRSKNYYTETIAPILERTLGKIGRGPNRRNKPAGKQFYEATIRTIKAVITTEKAFTERRCGIKQGAGYVLRPAYRNLADPNSLVWCMSYYAE